MLDFFQMLFAGQYLHCGERHHTENSPQLIPQKRSRTYETIFVNRGLIWVVRG
jgi:hypothetical protein